MKFTAGPPLRVVVIAFWTVEDRSGVFKTVEQLLFSCASVFHHALRVFYPAEHDSCAERQEIVTALQAGQLVHLDAWSLQIVFAPSGYRGVGGSVSTRGDLESFYGYASREPKQVSVKQRPGRAAS